MSRCDPLDTNLLNSGNVSSNTTRDLVMRELSKNGKHHSRRSCHVFFRECKFALVHDAFKELGACDAEYSDDWVMAWIDTTVSMERLSKLQSHQRVNHFPGMQQVCRKDCLATNLMKMQKCLPEEYDFFPTTYCLPRDVGRLADKFENKRGKYLKRVFIVKPHNSCQGEGIILTKSLTTVTKNKNAVCQKYISRPLLMDGYKFDMRIYTLVTSVDPLRIYVYNEGFVRMATIPYRTPSVANMKEKRMHLTNYSINKTKTDDTEMPRHNTAEDCKRSFAYLEEWLSAKGYPPNELWRKIDDIIVKTILSARVGLKRSYHGCFPVCRPVSSCFELLGFDVLLNHKMKPYLLEVNHSPSLGGSTTLDVRIKKRLMRDTLSLVMLSEEQINFIKNEEHKKTIRRLTNHNVTKELTVKERILRDFQEQQELTLMGNFRRVFPVSGDRYANVEKAAEVTHQFSFLGANFNKFL